MRALFLLPFLLALGEPSHAQDGTAPTRVRLFAPEVLGKQPVVGTLIEIVSGNLVVREDRPGEPTLSIPVGLIRILEESRGVISAAEGARLGLRRGALVGLTVGGGGGIVWGALRRQLESDDSRPTAERVNVLSYGLWGGAGATFAGALIGSTLGARMRERWEPLPIPLAALGPDGITFSAVLPPSRSGH